MTTAVLIKKSPPLPAVEFISTQEHLWVHVQQVFEESFNHIDKLSVSETQSRNPPPGEPSHGLHDFTHTIELSPLPVSHSDGPEATLPGLLTLHLPDTTLPGHLQHTRVIINRSRFPSHTVIYRSCDTSAPPFTPSSSAASLLFIRHRD